MGAPAHKHDLLDGKIEKKRVGTLGHDRHLLRESFRLYLINVNIIERYDADLWLQHPADCFNERRLS